KKITEITSHADVMPTIADALGWRQNVPAYGRSLFDSRQPRTAIVAQSNQHHRPIVWSVVTADRKTILEGRNQLRIIGLFDKNDRKLPFAGTAQGWDDNFAEVQRFQRSLLGRVIPDLSADQSPVASATRR